MKKIRDEKIYKEKYSEFGDYIKEEGFQFSERHAYRMMKVAEEFSDINVTKIGISKCLEVLKLPLSSRELVKEELQKENPDLDSVEKTILHNQELQQEIVEEIKGLTFISLFFYIDKHIHLVVVSFFIKYTFSSRTYKTLLSLT